MMLHLLAFSLFLLLIILPLKKLKFGKNTYNFALVENCPRIHVQRLTSVDYDQSDMNSIHLQIVFGRYLFLCNNGNEKKHANVRIHCKISAFIVNIFIGSRTYDKGTVSHISLHCSGMDLHMRIHFDQHPKMPPRIPKSSN